MYSVNCTGKFGKQYISQQNVKECDIVVAGHSIEINTATSIVDKKTTVCNAWQHHGVACFVFWSSYECLSSLCNLVIKPGILL